MSDLNKAIELACQAHAGQVDKAGQHYILHPMRLMLGLQEDEERIVAVLHDVIEDSDITLNDLVKYRFSKSVIDAIDCLSKRTSERYEDFIMRISSNKLARKIKIEDIKDNLDLTRMTSISDKDLARVAKYHNALKVLLKKNKGTQLYHGQDRYFDNDTMNPTPNSRDP